MKARYIKVLTAMCGCVGASYGILLNTAGVFYTPIAEDLMIGRGSVSLTTTIATMVAALSSMLAGKMIRTIGVRKMIVLASILLLGGTVLMYFAPDILIMDLLSVVRGFGGGLLAFVTATFVLNAWFHQHIGLFTSIAFAFSGLPGVFLSPLFSSVIGSCGWRTGYLVVAGVSLLFLLPALLFRFGMDPKEYGMEPYGEAAFRKHRSEGEQVLQDETRPFSYRSALFGMVVLYSLAVCYLAALIHHQPGYAETLGLGASVGALMVSCTNGANIAGKLVSGVLIDRIGTKKVILLLALLSLSGILLMLTVHTAWAMLAGAFLYGMTMANSATCIAMITRDAFGMNDYNKAYPLINFAGTAANALAITFMGLLYDIFHVYALLFVIAACMQIFVIFITITVYRMKARQVQ